jgi:hypothetical protein
MGSSLVSHFRSSGMIKTKFRLPKMDRFRFIEVCVLSNGMLALIEPMGPVAWDFRVREHMVLLADWGIKVISKDIMSAHSHDIKEQEITFK